MDADSPVFSADFSTANSKSSAGSAAVTVTVLSDAKEAGSLTTGTWGTFTAIAVVGSTCLTDLSACTAGWARGTVTRTGTGTSLALRLFEDFDEAAVGLADNLESNVALGGSEATAGGAVEVDCDETTCPVDMAVTESAAASVLMPFTASGSGFRLSTRMGDISTTFFEELAQSFRSGRVSSSSSAQSL